MMWNLLGCFGIGVSAPAIDSNFEPSVVLADVGMTFGHNTSNNTLAGWQLKGEEVHRFEPNGDGRIIAASPSSTGVVLVAENSGRSQRQLWWGSESGWTTGANLPHGPISQLLVSKNGTIWTEGDAGVHRSTDKGETWTRMELSTDLNLGAIKLGEHDNRVVFAGRNLMASTDNGENWSVIYPGKVSTTDGEWVAEQTESSGLRIGRIRASGVDWTANINDQWNASAIAGNDTGVTLVATKKLSTKVVIFQGNANGSQFKGTPIESRPAWVGVGQRLMWVDHNNGVHLQP